MPHGDMSAKVNFHEDELVMASTGRLHSHHEAHSIPEKVISLGAVDCPIDLDCLQGYAQRARQHDYKRGEKQR